jgi:chorismate synthase
LLSAGESHGPQITALLDGMPAGLRLDPDRIAAGMKRRQVGFGRGGRMRIEADEVEFLSGVRFGETTGAPITIVIRNRDHEKWAEVLRPFGEAPATPDRRLSRPRPGHADLVGMLKYARDDARDILERASARETVARVACGEVMRAFLGRFGVETFSHVVRIGSAEAKIEGMEWAEIRRRAESNDLRCAEGYERMRACVESAAADADTVGGIFEVVVTGLVPGLGSSMAPDRKLDGRLAAAMLSVPAVKGCEIGAAFANASRRGSEVHDEILPGEDLGDLPRRRSNRAGGLEGGMTTGEALLCRGAMKPISTLRRPLQSIDMDTGSPSAAAFERSDVCAVPAAGVIGEAVVMITLADAVLESFGGDVMARIVDAVESYRRSLNQRLRGMRGGE